MIYKSNLQLPTMDRTISSVTLASTLKALYASGDYPSFGTGYFNRIGRKMKLRAFGKMTTVLTPGNLTITAKWGSGVDDTSTTLASSAALALSASQTNLSFLIELDVVCVTVGGSGSLLATGIAHFNNALIANTLQPIMIPDSAPSVVGTLDLTGTNIVSIQAMRSGSTAETMQLYDFDVIVGSGSLHP